MQQPRSGDQTLLRHLNRSAVLEVVEHHAPISRATIARLTGLSIPTISAVVGDFLASGLLEEIGPGHSNGGRRPRLLQVNPNAVLVLGVDLGGTRTRLGLINLTGTILERHEVATAKTPEALVTQIGHVVQGQGSRRGQVLGVGIGVPGITNATTGMLEYAPALDWRQVPLGKLLAQELGLLVAVDNDVNATALGESRFGVGRELEDFAYVAVGTGVGAGVVLGRQLHRGRDWAAGEVGYLVPGREFLNDYRQGFGAWEQLVSGPGLARRAAQVHGFPGDNPRQVFEAAGTGDRRARAAVDEFIAYLALGLANIAAVLNPQAIVLGGGVMRHRQALLPQLQALVDRAVPKPPQLVISELGADAGVLGAGAIALEQVRRHALIGGYRE